MQRHLADSRRCEPRADRPSRARGFTLLELIATVAVVAVVSAAAAAGVRALTGAVTLESARVRLALAMMGAARSAYARQEPVEVIVEPGADHVTVRTVGREPATIALPAGARIESAPVARRVRFHASGLADNATIVIAAGSTRTATVVVNQRATVR